MSDTTLFGEAVRGGDVRKSAEPARPPGPAKLLRAVRNQVLLIPTDLEALLPADHAARGMWEIVGTLDLSRFLSAIDSREDAAGRPASRRPIPKPA